MKGEIKRYYYKLKQKLVTIITSAKVHRESFLRVAVEMARSALAEILKFLCSGEGEGILRVPWILWKLNGVRW